ncbi:DUF4190 domain-containing protein [Natranaerobius thermophilus]|uniref:DUF4190 domain-containing protein n=1 Tax=Natranaerobius thermophilus (strain ATCC BAA-1301 / DSM 18059 / JW/NM-WN-LF) TaxID=457570 RepID=B2A866_NATTJ|nr:DUF4190 domain-containing protein [Natranaerobius thermophilus]ACB84432.1 hypothetical protein Nther_0847 [Natranaerobius thermophilus JW/NM-WN-LF]
MSNDKDRKENEYEEHVAKESETTEKKGQDLEGQQDVENQQDASEKRSEETDKKTIETTSQEASDNLGSGSYDGDYRGQEDSQPREKERIIERVVEKEKQDNTLGTISLVTGIIGIVFFFCCFGVDIALGVVALVTGILGYNKGQDYSLAGIIMGAIIVGLNLLGIIGIFSLNLLDSVL